MVQATVKSIWIKLDNSTLFRVKKLINTPLQFNSLNNLTNVSADFSCTYNFQRCLGVEEFANSE